MMIDRLAGNSALKDSVRLMLESRRATLSAAALSALAQNGTAVFVCDEKHLPCGVLLPYAQHSRQLAAARAQLSLTLPAKKRFWQQLVTAKIDNQAECLALCGKTQEAAFLHSRARAVTSGDKDNLEAAAAAGGFTEDEVSLITESGEGYRLKFKAIELLQALKDRLFAE